MSNEYKHQVKSHMKITLAAKFEKHMNTDWTFPIEPSYPIE
jgi:hypothetical protein